MNIAFLVSSVGDTNLALSTIKSMEKSEGYQAFLIALTPVAQNCIASFDSSSLALKTSLSELLKTEDQLEQLNQLATENNIHFAYIGIPSENNEIPLQIAKSIKTIPVLMAYEFMFKPESHALWNYFPQLKNKPNIQWALPLAAAISDFDTMQTKHIIGHMSIDEAYALKSNETNSLNDTRQLLQIQPDESLIFISSTTQPKETDSNFLDCLLLELVQHPTMQARLGIHPGIKNLDEYMIEILGVYQRHEDAKKQFKIILPQGISTQLITPELSINNPKFQDAFLRVDINGTQARAAADRVTQAVPGALLNQSAMEGKPVYTLGKPYLPGDYFAQNIHSFYSAQRKPAPPREALGLNIKTAPERCLEIIEYNTVSNR